MNSCEWLAGSEDRLREGGGPTASLPPPQLVGFHPFAGQFSFEQSLFPQAFCVRGVLFTLGRRISPMSAASSLQSVHFMFDGIEDRSCLLERVMV